MKYLFPFNLLLFMITLILYLTIFYGLMAQVILGYVQVLISILLLFRWSKLSKEAKTLLYIYYAMIGIYVLGYLSQINFNFVIFVMILPMVIATYFTFITFKISK